MTELPWNGPPSDRKPSDLVELSPHELNAEFVIANSAAVVRLLAFLLRMRGVVVMPETVAEHGLRGSVRYGFDRKHSAVIVRYDETDESG